MKKKNRAVSPTSATPLAAASHPTLLIEALEPRVLFSGAPVEAPETDEPADTQPANEAVATTPAASETGTGESASGDSGATLVATGSGSADLNAETLAAIADAAKQRWIQSGVTAEQLAALDSVTYQIRDLGGHLGKANGYTITIDDDAAGSGAWFVDSTPLVDEEYTPGSSTVLNAVSGGAAAGRFDLLSTLLHEQGHILGLGDLPGVRGDVMGGSLATGLRRLPVDYQALGATPGSIVGDAFLDPDWSQKGAAINGEAVGDQLSANTRSIALSGDGNIMAIGALGNNGNGTDSGHVRVFVWNGTAWAQRGADIDGEAAGDWSGISVALSADGNTLAIGATRNDGNGTDSGHVRVFVWNGSAWTQRGADLNGEAAGDAFGHITELSDDGNTLAVSGRLNDGNGTDAGHVRIFQWNGSAWVQRGNDIDGEAAGDDYGRALALSANGNTVAIGARLNDGNGTESGHVRVFDWNGSAWIQRGIDLDGESAFDHSGYAVALSSDGNVLAIGGPLNDGAGQESGHVRVFVWNGSAWVQRGLDIDGDPTVDNTGLAGFSVSLSGDGNILAFGEPWHDGNGTNSGQARVFFWNGSAWVQRGSDLNGDAAGDQFGWSVALSRNGGTLAVGAPFNDGNGSDAGRVRVYQFSPTDLSVVKSSPNESVRQGDTVTYTINVTNYGTTAVTGARVTDTFSDLLTGVTWTAAFTPGATGNASGTGDIDELVHLPSLGSIIYTVTATVVSPGTADLAAQNIVTNTARVQAPSGVVDTNLANNADSDSDLVVLAATGGTGTFSDSGQALGNHATFSVVLGDVDGDGDLDMVEGNYNQANRLWLNNGSGSFTDSGQSLGNHATLSVALGDVDGDGDLDLIEGNNVQANKVWLNNGSGIFTDSGQSLGSNLTRSLAVGDVDGDGDLDLVIGLQAQSNQVWLNNGLGVFSVSGQTLGNHQTRAVALGDVDGDGDLDMLEGNYNHHTRVWLNNGSGTFADSGQSLGNHGTFSVALGDLDGDGDLDLVEGSYGQANRLWLNNGSGSFTVSSQTLGKNYSRSVALGDVDGDGDLDLVEGNRFEANRVWLNNGSGSFTDSGQSLGNHSTLSVALGDVDGDGDLDFAEGNFGQANRVWINSDTDLSLVKTSPNESVRQGDTVTYTITVTNNGPAAVTGARVTDTFSDLLTGVGWTAVFSGGATGNASGSGDIDELVTLPAGATVVYTVTATVVSAGTANLAAQSIVTNTARVQAPSGVVETNLSNNADSDSDLVVLAATGGTGSFSDSGQALGNHATRSVALGDVDGDGDLDIIEGNNGQRNRVLLNDGNGRFTDSGQTLGSHGTWMIALGDLDGDGDLDYIEANGANPGGFTQPNRVWMNDGFGNFTDSGQLLENLSTGSISLGDLDSDGDIDFVEGNYNGPNFAWFNDGSGVFVKGSQTITSALTESIALGDVDGDGDLDLVEGNFNQANRVWLNNGMGSFTNSGQALGSNSTASIALGDLDGDADLDMVEGNRNQPNRVWINDGTGTFADFGQTLGSHSEVVILGDLDGDGDLDFVAGSFGQPNRVWLNDGLGSFTDSGQSLGSSFTDNLALGDLDNDGVLDLVEGNNNQPNLVWFNESLTHATTAVLIDNAGNLVIRDILGGTTADNVVIKRVVDDTTLIEYLSILDKTNTVGTVIPGAQELKQHEVRVEWGTWTGDLVIDLRGGDDTVTFSGVLGDLPGGVRVIDGAGFDRTVLKGALVLADDHDAVIVSERIEGAKGGALTVGGTGSIHLEATGGAGQFDGIKLSGNTLKATGTGDITLLGTSGNTGNGNDGLFLTKTTVEVDSGDITLTGTGAGGSVSNGNGIFLTGGTQIRQLAGGGGGLIALTGGSAASGQNANGIKMAGGATIQARGTGSIQMLGTAPDATKGNIGVIVSGAVRTESGSITIHGTGGDNGDKNIGVVVNKATIASSDGGALLITGTAGSGGKNNTGLSLVSSTVSTTGSADVTLTGTGSETTKSLGLSLSKSTVRAVNGSLLLTGHATATGAGGGNMGVRLAGSTLEITGTGGTGSLTLHGTGGGTLNKNAGIQLTKSTVTVAGSGGIELIGEAPAGSGGGNSGVIIGSETTLTAASGDIVIDGTARGSGKNNVGVLFNKATVTATGGNLSVTGRGSLGGTETGNIGVTVKASTLNAGAGLFLTGTGGRGTKYNHGIFLYPATLNAGGSLVLSGTADALTTGALSTGIYAALGSSLTGGGGSSITGIGGGGPAGHGLYFKADTTTTVPLGSIVGTKGPGSGSDETGGFDFGAE